MAKDNTYVLDASPPKSGTPLHSNVNYTTVANLATNHIVSCNLESSVGVKNYVTPTTYSAVTQDFSSFKQASSSCSTIFAKSLKVVKRGVLLSLLRRRGVQLSPVRGSYNVLVCSSPSRSARTKKDNYNYSTMILTSCVLPGVMSKR